MTKTNIQVSSQRNNNIIRSFKKEVKNALLLKMMISHIQKTCGSLKGPLVATQKKKKIASQSLLI